ncbi:MAG: glycoside hydrolase family 127 protein, partial [Betaproteobacteria bacterium]|nr:glycoside hydrolase family 127 protein [Betaproteobacteria bacterium]
MPKSTIHSSRRNFLSASSRVTIAAALPISGIAAASPPLPKAAKALPLADVYLLPSPYFDAVTSNRRYLLSLEPDRLLHNFLTSAGLPPKGEVYGGWEKDTIAGHTLGHYLTALSLLHAQTGDEEACRRANYIVGELGRAQRAHGDGYVGGFTRKRKDGSIVDGKEIFAELMRGDIRALPFDLNGCWVPWYNWHKLFSGLSAAQQLCGIPAAREIAIHLAEYIGRVFAALSDEQVQAMLACEHGGINESFADLYADTRDPRWLA